MTSTKRSKACLNWRSKPVNAEHITHLTLLKNRNIPYEVSVTHLALIDYKLSIIDDKTTENKKRKVEFCVEESWRADEKIHQ